MGKIRFISDLHFGHANILYFDNRPFKTIEDMENYIIKVWNENVAKDDLIYILGDVAWTKEACAKIGLLNGQKFLIQGNHDKRALDAKTKKLFCSIKDYHEVTVKLEDETSRKVTMSHYFIPMYNGHFHGGIMLHGHSHVSQERNQELEIAAMLNERGFENEIYNVGAMLPYINYIPRTLDEIIAGAAGGIDNE